jgi:hypothetical protein
MLQHELSHGPKKLDSQRFKFVLKTALANRIELLTGKFSNQPYSDLMDEVIEDLFTSLQSIVKKKP